MNPVYNKNSAYFLSQDALDNIEQLDLTVAYSSLNAPVADGITTWQDPGVGIYPLSDNRGATNASSAKVSIAGEAYDFNSLSLIPQVAQVEVDKVYLNSDDGGKLYRGSVDLEAAGTGDVVGPVSAVDENLVIYDGITGKLVKDSGINISAIAPSGPVIQKGIVTFNMDQSSSSGLVALAASYDLIDSAVSTGINPNSLLLANDITITKLRLSWDASPASATTLTFTLMINGIATAHTIVVDYNGPLSVEINISQPLLAGEVVSLKATSDTGPSSTITGGWQGVLEYDQTLIAGSGGVAPNGVSTTDNIVVYSDATGTVIKDSGIAISSIGTGDVVGPVASIDNGVVIYDGLTGKLLKGASNNKIVPGGTSNVRIQDGVASTTFGNFNVIVGHDTFNKEDSNATGNTVLGSNIFSLGALTSGNFIDNVVIGSNALQNASMVNNIPFNTILGSGACANLTSTSGVATNNIAIGRSAGSNWVDGESNNICIGNDGVIADAGVLRIGTLGDQTTAFIQGIDVAEPAVNNTYAIGINQTDGQITKYNVPMAEIAFSNFVTPVTLAGGIIDTAYEIAFANTFLTNNSNKFSQLVATDGRIQYDGADTLLMHVACSMSVETVTNNDTIEFYLAKNSVIIANSTYRQKFGTSIDWNNLAAHNLISMSTGDYISAWFINRTSATGITYGNFNLVVIGH